VKPFRETLMKFYKITKGYHGDLHGGNVFVLTNSDGEIQVRFIDFGSHREFKNNKNSDCIEEYFQKQFKETSNNISSYHNKKRGRIFEFEKGPLLTKNEYILNNYGLLSKLLNKHKIPRTPNAKRTRAPSIMRTKNMNNEKGQTPNAVKQVRERYKRLKNTTNSNMKFVKPINNSRQRAIAKAASKGNFGYGLIKAGPSQKLSNSRRKFRNNRLRGQKFNHEPRLVPSTENLMKINLKNIKKLPLQTKRNIQTTAGKIIQEYYNDDGRSEMTNIQRKANQILTLLWDDL
jgi:hypothetical protein